MARLFRSFSRGSSKRHSSDPIPIETARGGSARYTSDHFKLETNAAGAGISKWFTSDDPTGRKSNSKRYSLTPVRIENHIPVNPVEDDLPSPFGDPGQIDLSETELREIAYEILVGASRSSTSSRPLTYIPQSERSVDRGPLPASVSTVSKSLTLTAVSKMKKAFGLKTTLPKGGKRVGGVDSVSQWRVKKAVTVEELMRVQMGISELRSSSIRRAMLRVSAGQLGKPIESIVLPLELLQHLKPSDFPDQEEYETCQKRHLKVLEAGLILHPSIPLGKTDITTLPHLRKIIRSFSDKKVDLEPNNESKQVLRTLVTSLACRSLDGGSLSETCHWADGFPLNVRLYQVFLEACFDINDATSFIDEIDVVLELLKKTWSILGMNQMLHNLCFSWVLLHRYVTTGRVENDLLFASSNLLMEVENDAKGYKDPFYSKMLGLTLSSISGWAKKRLLSYHDTFRDGDVESMQSIVSLAVLSEKILIEDVSHEHHKKKKKGVEFYIRSSLRTAFARKMEKILESNDDAFPILSILAREVSELAFNEKAMFSPILKKWDPLATGLAMATLHSCYGRELKKFVSGIGELTIEAVEVFEAANRLEKELVQIAVEDSVESEDGGKSIIQEMPPYEAESIISDLVKSWIQTRVDRLKEWIDRFLQQEKWDPRANKERFAPSSVELLRIVDETFEAFSQFPAQVRIALLNNLVAGLDKCLEQYILQAKYGCGSRSTYVPTLPPLTRCSMGSKFSVFKKKEKSSIASRRKTETVPTNGESFSGVLQLCVRINTLHHIRMELEVLERRTNSHFMNKLKNWFELSSASCSEGIKELCEAMAYKVVFHDLSHVLQDRLYVGEVSSSRIEPFLQELEQYLKIISSTVHDKISTRVITNIMKASFEGFLLILLAGGPSRAFTRQDSEIIEEDLKFLTDLFWSNEDGLSDDLIDKHSSLIRGVLSLFRTDPENLIEQFKRVYLETYGSSVKLKIPPTINQWDPTEPNTILRVLCHRNEEVAAKFLKKTYNLPKKL